MAKLITFTYANEVINQTIDGHDNQIINNPLLALKPMFIPGQLSFSVVFGITDIDPNKDHIFQYKLVSPDGQVVVDTGDIKITKYSNMQDKKVDGFLGSLDLRNVVFRTRGFYKTELIFNGDKLMEGTILVTEDDPNGDSYN